MAQQRSIEVSQACGYCGRTLLLGEDSTRFSRDGHTWVEVCALCRASASDHGWSREGLRAAAPTAPGRVRPRLRTRPNLGRPAGARADEPELRQRSQVEAAAEVYNRSAFQRTVAGIAKSLGAPCASLVPLEGGREEVVITVAWDISWYQYLVASGTGQPISLVDRGYEVSTLDTRFTRWNARLDADGRIQLDEVDEGTVATPTGHP